MLAVHKIVPAVMLVVVAAVGVAAPGWTHAFQEPGRDEVAKELAASQWRKFTGTWTVTSADGRTSKTRVSESHPGVFVHQGDDFTVMVGWDARSQSMHAFGFSTGDQPFEQHWHLVDDQPTFVGRLVGTEERFRWSIADGVWTMDFGAFGASTATRDGDP